MQLYCSISYLPYIPLFFSHIFLEMPKKGEKITDTAYLEMLAKAREKANSIRKGKADEKKKIKLASDMEHQNKLQEAEDKLKNMTAPKEKKEKKEKKPPPPPESSSEDESEESEEESEEEEPPPPPKKIKKKLAPEPVTRKQPQQQMTHEQHRMMVAFKSLYQ